MSLLLDQLREKHSYDKKEGQLIFGMSTDFDIFDYANASIESFSNGGRMINGGFFPGVTSIIGKSMSGKTSWAVKLAASTAAKYGGDFFFRDAEKTNTPNRLYKLTGWDLDQYKERCDYRNEELNHDFIFNEIKLIAQMKETLKKQIQIDTGLTDRWGNRIKVYPPTIFKPIK